MTRLKVTLTRSTIGTTAEQAATIRGLGLRRIGGSRTLANTPAVRGMVRSVLHMISVEELREAPAAPTKARRKTAKEDANG